MHIHSIHIKNYRSFRNSGVIEISPRRTVVVGANNAGKSSLLDCLSGATSNDPHRSARSVWHSDIRVQSCSDVRFVMHGTGKDVGRWMDSARLQPFTVPDSLTKLSGPNAQDVVAYLRSRDWVELRVPGQASAAFLGLARHGIALTLDMQGERPKINRVIGGHTLSLEEHLWAGFLGRDVVRLKAERLNIRHGSISSRGTLASDASNLPTVLHELQSRNTPRFEQVIALAQGVLPSIRHVQVRVRDDKDVEIVVWPCDRDTMRDDLAVPLDACGSGVSQVLVMAYVLATADEPKTLIIDEPNSFLHPGALARLIELFRSPDHAHHQYIIATHSPEVISAFEPERIIRLELVEGETKVESMDPSLVDTQRRILRDVGARLSSVFGADRILWVEGPTEEQVFERLIRSREPARLRGTRILHVLDTGSFNKKLAKQSVNLYRRLHDGAALIPKAVGFVFDRESLPDADVETLRAELGNAHFLERKMIESYLLHPQAIAVRLAEHLEEDVDRDQVDQWFVENSDRKKDRGKQPEFGAKIDRAVDETGWLETVHAGNLLERLFSELSETRAAFQKPGDSVALAEWIIAKEPEFLDPLAEELMVALPVPEPLS